MMYHDISSICRTYWSYVGPTAGGVLRRGGEISDVLQFGTKSIGVLGSVAVLLNNILGPLGFQRFHRGGGDSRIAAGCSGWGPKHKM